MGQKLALIGQTWNHLHCTSLAANFTIDTTMIEKKKLHNWLKTLNQPPTSFYKWYSKEEQRALLREHKTLSEDTIFLAKVNGQTVFLSKWKACCICEKTRQWFDPYWDVLVPLSENSRRLLAVCGG